MPAELPTHMNLITPLKGLCLEFRRIRAAGRGVLICLMVAGSACEGPLNSTARFIGSRNPVRSSRVFRVLEFQATTANLTGGRTRISQRWTPGFELERYDADRGYNHEDVFYGPEEAFTFGTLRVERDGLAVEPILALWEEGILSINLAFDNRTGIRYILEPEDVTVTVRAEGADGTGAVPMARIGEKVEVRLGNIRYSDAEDYTQAIMNEAQALQERYRVSQSIPPRRRTIVLMGFESPPPVEVDLSFRLVDRDTLDRLGYHFRMQSTTAGIYENLFRIYGRR